MDIVAVALVLCVLLLVGGLAWSLVRQGALRSQLALAAAQSGGGAEVQAARDALARERDTLLAEQKATATALGEARAQVEGERRLLAQARQDGDALRGAEAAARQQAEQARTELARAHARVEALERACGEHEAQRAQLGRQLEALHAQVAELTGQAHKARAEHDAALQRCAQVEAFLHEAQGKLDAAFRDAASKVFDEKAVLLEQRIQAAGEVSKQGLDATLKPFAEHVGQLKARIEQVNVEQARERGELRGKIDELANLNRGMAETTDRLTQALKGNAKVRGDWGELMLDTVLKSSGLVEGMNYEKQAGTRDEDGALQRPDVIVKLPDHRKVVVDSKVNLVAWSDHVGASTPEQADAALLSHAAALRRHVLDLAAKNYPRTLGEDALEVTVLFVPIEGALAAALATDPTLQEDAMKRNVALASPNTLMAMLRLVDRLWTRDRITRQVKDIRELAQSLVDSVVLFKERFDAVGASLAKAKDQYEGAAKTLDEGNQSIYRRAGRLAEISGRGKKALPAELQVASDVPQLGLLGEAWAEPVEVE